MLFTKLLNANPMYIPTNVLINTLAKLAKTPTLMNQKAHNPSGGGFCNVGSIGIKHAYSFSHKNVVEATQKGSQLIVDSMDKMS